MLAPTLYEERTSAIGGILAVLEWRVVARGVGFTFRGHALQVRMDEGLLGDNVGRLDDWEWLKDDRRIVLDHFARSVGVTVPL